MVTSLADAPGEVIHCAGADRAGVCGKESCLAESARSEKKSNVAARKRSKRMQSPN